MSNYTEIKAAINYTLEPSKAIQGWYNDDDVTTDPPRRFLAYVLGKSTTKPGQRNSVLGYQYSGLNTSEDDSKKWRCYKVDEFQSLSQIVFELPDSSLDIPEPLTPDEVKRQNCVDIPGGRIVRAAKYVPATTTSAKKKKQAAKKRMRPARTKKQPAKKATRPAKKKKQAAKKTTRSAKGKRKPKK